MAKLSDAATTWINEATADLAAGRRTPADLPEPLRNLWLAAYADGMTVSRAHMEVLHAQLLDAEHDRNRFYEKLYGDTYTLNERIDAACDRHADAQTSTEFFERVMADACSPEGHIGH